MKIHMKILIIKKKKRFLLINEMVYSQRLWRNIARHLGRLLDRDSLG